jgi:hypothetical protein|tara:strand:+ start:500 stop:1018 length:519 start_codon:yes stop_codon:yes gene_type:complete
MTETKKKGRGRPKGAPNKPKLELITKRTELPKDADVYEILCQAELVAKESEDLAAQGIRVFSERNGAVKLVLQWVFDDNINSTLPEGKTPYNRDEAPASDLAQTSLRFESRQFKYFVTEEVPQTRRETMWIQLLEGIPQMEAELMELVKDGVWPFKNITKNVAQKAFPEVIK